MGNQNQGPAQAVPFGDYLTHDYRQGIALKLMIAMMKIFDLPVPDRAIFHILMGFEDRTYKRCESMHEYLHRISLKMLELKAKSAKPAAYRGQYGPPPLPKGLNVPPPPPNPTASSGQHGPPPPNAASVAVPLLRSRL